jgi:hypothetical protein
MPELKLAELIDGIVIVTSAVSRIHADWHTHGGCPVTWTLRRDVRALDDT